MVLVWLRVGLLLRKIRLVSMLLLCVLFVECCLVKLVMKFLFCECLVRKMLFELVLCLKSCISVLRLVVVVLKF